MDIFIRNVKKNFAIILFLIQFIYRSKVEKSMYRQDVYNEEKLGQLKINLKRLNDLNQLI